MNIKLLAGSAAAAALALVASSASAVEIVSISAVAGNVNPSGLGLITDFNSTGGTGADSHGGTINDLSPFFTFTQDHGAYTRDGHAGLDSGVSAPPPADNLGPVGSYYETVLGGGSATLTSLFGITQFSFYMGSPDTYNHLTLTLTDQAGSQVHLNGVNIWGGSPPGNGDQSLGFTVTYTFAPDAVKSIQFTSDSNAFEFDTLRGGVPEPASWGLMILGFGAAGAMLRRRKAALA